MANYLLKPGEKARTVTTIIWVEDLERRWGEHWKKKLYGYLADLRMQVACSPVHDQDTYSDDDVRNWCRRHQDPDTGEVATEFTNMTPSVGDPKKPHIHIILIVKGPQFREDFSEQMLDLVFINPNKWQRVVHLDVMIRYLAHMDNPDKYQYSCFDILPFGGFSLKPLSITKTDEYSKATAFCSCFDYCEENNLKYFHQLLKWARDLGDYDILCCVLGRASVFGQYFKSKSDEKAAKRKKAEKERERALQAAQAAQQ